MKGLIIVYSLSFAIKLICRFYKYIRIFLNDNLQLSAQSIALHEKILNAFSVLCRKVETNHLVTTEDYQYWVFEQVHKAAMMQIKALKN